MTASSARSLQSFPNEGSANTAPVSRRFSDYPNFTKVYDAPAERKWQIEVQRRLIEYAKMARGWDSYDAPPVGWDTGMFVLSVLNDVMRMRTPIPQVVPIVGGRCAT